MFVLLTSWSEYTLPIDEDVFMYVGVCVGVTMCVLLLIVSLQKTRPVTLAAATKGDGRLFLN